MTTVLLAAGAQQAKAQPTRMLRYLAQEAVNKKDWHVATQHLYRLYQRDTASLKLKYELAEAYRLDYDIDPALSFYQKVTLADSKLKYPLSGYWWAQMLKSKARYVEAKKRFLVFLSLKLQGPEFEYYLKKAQLETEACDMAMDLMKKPLSLKIESFGQGINTKASEYAPVEVDSLFFFSAMKTIDKKDEEPEILNNRIYRSEYKNSRWQKVKPLDTTINKPAYHHSNLSFGPDYKSMVFARCAAKNQSDYACEIYYAQLKGKTWQPDKKMPAPVNLPGSNNTMPHLALVKGKAILFFCSDRPGGYGGLDIWYCYKTDSLNYSQPRNAGSGVNTPDDEVSPWYAAAENKLYFSSPYHKGLGGFDIFKSAMKDTVFGPAQNAGYPINSSHNDVYYSLNKKATKVYLSSNRLGSVFEGKKLCACNDIYTYPIDSVKTVVKDTVIQAPKKVDTVVVMKEQLKLLVPLTLYFHNDEPDPRTKGIVTTKSYESTFRDYEKLLPQYSEEYSRGLKGIAHEHAVSDITAFFNDSLETGFHNLEKFCETLKKILLKNETVKITMKGYCSPLASTDYNINLAKRRVSSLVNYFKTYDHGFFVRYINNPAEGEGKLIFEEEDIGELSGSQASDDLKDKRNSVYSPFAAAERKIQILAVRFGE